MKGISSPIPDVGSFAWGRAILARSGRLHPQAIALLLEHNATKALPADLREAAFKTLRKQQGRGRRPKRSAAALDFIMCEVIDLYEGKLKEYRAEAAKRRKEAKSRHHVLARAEQMPGEQALDCVLKVFRSELGVISRESLRNRISLSKRVRGWEPPES